MRNSNDLKYEEVTKLLTELYSFVPNVTLAVVGGEPLFRPDLKEILLFARNIFKSSDIEILTNGTLINERNIGWLSDLASGFNISLEGATALVNDSIRGEGAFNRTINGIKLLRKKEKPVTVRMTYFHQKEDEAEKLMRFLPELGVNNFNFRYVVPVGNASHETTSSEQYKRQCERIWEVGKELKLRVGFSDPFPEILINTTYRKEVEDDKELMCGKAVAGCSVAFRLLYIDPEGLVKLCPYFPVYCDDAKRKSLSEIWYKNRVISAFRGVRRHLGGKCGGCEFKFGCGGCLGSANASGDFLSGEPRCWH